MYLPVYLPDGECKDLVTQVSLPSEEGRKAQETMSTISLHMHIALRVTNFDLKLYVQSQTSPLRLNWMNWHETKYFKNTDSVSSDATIAQPKITYVYI